jgi:hypothetical protein
MGEAKVEPKVEVVEDESLRISMSISVRKSTKDLVEDLANSLNTPASRLAETLMLEGYEARERKGNIYMPAVSPKKPAAPVKKPTTPKKKR